MKTQKLVVQGVAFAVSLAVLYATVYYGGLAWKRSQTGEKLVGKTVEAQTMKNKQLLGITMIVLSVGVVSYLYTLYLKKDKE